MSHRQTTPKPACWWQIKNARRKGAARSTMCLASLVRKTLVWRCVGEKQLTRGIPHMAIPLDKQLERWVSAGVVDASTAARIRTFEESQSPSERLRWPVLLAVGARGGVVFAGVVLVLGADCGELSPALGVHAVPF